MSRPVILVITLLVTAATASVATMFVIRSQPEHVQLSNEQRLTRQKFFGSSNELPPIEKGQEMRPRW